MRLGAHIESIVLVAGVVLLAATLTSEANAQQEVITDTPQVQLEFVQPQPNPAWQEYELQTLKESARRSRNALIGLTASYVVGIALSIPGLNRQCVTFTNSNNQEEIRCTQAGRALVGVGFPLAFGGATGMLISGIMLGVRNGKIRRRERDIAAQRSRAVQWDPARSSLVF
jgi:hypothetical protein